MPVANTQPVFPPVSGQPVASTWGQAVSEHVNQRFTSVADRDAKWTTPPNGAKCITTDLGLTWIRKAGVWVPTQISATGGWQSMGGFPAGEYNWPAADANLAGYMANSATKDLMFPAGLTAWLGMWTVEASLQIAPTDAGDVTLKTNMDSLVHANTSKLVFGVVSFVSTDIIGSGKQLLWRMYKHANTTGWTGSYIRFTVTYESSY